jgi:zinc protease
MSSKRFSLSLLVALLGGAVACGPSQKKDTTTGSGLGTGDNTGPNGGDTGVADTEAPPPILTFPDDPFRKDMPEGSDPRDFSLPAVQKFNIGRDITAYLIENHSLPTITATLEFEGGSINDPRGKVGMASVCMDLVSEGTEKLDKLAFRAALADVASSVSSWAGNENQGVSMSTLTKNFDTTFELFRDTVISPGFRKSDLERMIKRRLESLKQAKASAASVAQRLKDRVLYGERHPFGKIVTEDSYAAIGVDDCKRYHSSYIKPRGARLYVVGDMTQKQVSDKFGPLLGKSWRGAPRRPARLGKPRSQKGKVFFVDIPNAEQSTIYAMHFGPLRTAQDFFANNLMSGVLGGSFSSRVNMNLRENRGYTYGARATLGYSRSYGELIASSSVKVNTTRQSILEFFKEMSDLALGRRPATPEELGREVSGAILSLPGRFATARAALARYRGLVYYGLPLDYYNSYVKNVKDVTIDQVNASAKKYLKPTTAIVLVVGDGDSPQIHRDDAGKDVPWVGEDSKPVTLRDSLTELVKTGTIGKGDFVELDADGNVVKK